MAVFDSTVERLRADFMTKLPEQLRAYFDNRLVHLLRDNVAAGCGKWTNNACESINHVLKSTVQWRPSKIPELVTTLRSLVTSQYVDADRALIGRGDFVLRPQFARRASRWRTGATCPPHRSRRRGTTASDFRFVPAKSHRPTAHSVSTVRPTADASRISGNVLRLSAPRQRQRNAVEKT